MIFWLFCSLSGAVPPPADNAVAMRWIGWVERMESVVPTVNTATWELRQVEYVDGSLNKEVQAEYKFRKDGALYITWTGNVTNGRELLYVPGWNDGRMRVQIGSFLPNVNLAPDGRLAMKGQRHTVHEASILRTAEIITRSTRKLAASPYQGTIEDLGVQTIAGDKSECFKVTTPKDLDHTYYSYRSDVCMNVRTGLPSRVQSYDIEDGEMRMVEDYIFGKLQVNPALTDIDFSPDNPDYNF